MDINEIIDNARAREEVVALCLAGDLNAQWEVADAELRRLDQEKREKLSDGDERLTLAQQVADLEQRMRDHEVVFRFRALPYRQFQKLQDTCRKPDATLDVEKMVPALLLACMVEPKPGDAAQLERLLDVLSQAQVDALWSAAWGANTDRADIPKSVRASALIASSEAK